MNDIDSLKLFLAGMGLSEEEVDTLKKDKGDLCSHCKHRKTGNWAYFVPCHHFVCYNCLDSLYDNYILTDASTMFVCPFCQVTVTDWTNKLKKVNQRVIKNK